MPHALWKGSLSFGLVSLPVALYAATHDDAIDFDWLDRRTMDPVGYKRVNKRTGKEVSRENIVKGVKHGDDYVIVEDDELRKAFPQTTQTIAVDTFVEASEIPFVYLERPYYVAPIGKDAKVYSLLREALQRSTRVGLARVVIQTKEHIAALIADGPALILTLLRWPAEIRSWADLDLPPLPSSTARADGMGAKELKMANQLIESMIEPFNPNSYTDRFRDALIKLIETKAKAGQVQVVEQPPEAPSSNVVDLTELLKRSLNRDPRPGKRGGRSSNGQAKRAATRKPRSSKTSRSATAR